MAQDAGQAGGRVPELVHVQRNVWEQVREERRQLKELVGQLTRTLRIRESDLAAMLDREQEMAAQVAALKQALSEALVHWSDASAYAYHDAPFPHERDNSRPAQRYRALLALSATTPAPADAGQEG